MTIYQQPNNQHPIANDYLTLPIASLSGVGSQLVDKLDSLGIKRVFDLLLHLPRDYEDKSQLVPFNQLTNGQSALLQGQVVLVDKNKRGLTVTLQEVNIQGQLQPASVQLRFFKTYPSLLKTMQLGTLLRVFAEVKINRFGTQLHHPEYKVTTAAAPLAEAGLLPIYPSVKGLTQNKLRTLVKMALKLAKRADNLELLPVKLITAVANVGFLAALQQIHFPTLADNGNGDYNHSDNLSQQQLVTALLSKKHPACYRLALEELSVHQLSVLKRRQKLQQPKAPRCQANSPLATQLIANLPYTLTHAQQRVVAQIYADVQTSTPMLRLVQGDVGAGKTLVAALAACQALDSGWQVAVMAPTEILAEQHLHNFKAWLEPLGIQVGWLAGKQKGSERSQTEQAVAENSVQLVVGTHALFQAHVCFAKLGLVIIDEQHRFGVEQRLALIDKGVAGGAPHQLMMTATPIPRTLAMSAYGDMDASIIDELPPGRTPVTTVTVSRDRRDEVIARVAANCSEGKQAYWVCPLVAASTQLDAQAAEATFADLRERLKLRIGLVYGKMKAEEKQATMQAFKNHELDLLVATTVIEVGVDVPNASLMIIENAERLGLSQLHQLRGRVGRGATQSFCVLLYQPPLSPEGIERLNILRDSSDGFVIAEKDLQLRGAGELLGKRQTGNVGFYVMDLVRDSWLLADAKTLAAVLLNDVKFNNAQTAGVLINRWLPEAEKYAFA